MKTSRSHTDIVPDKHGRIPQIGYMRALSCVAIIFIHVLAASIGQFSDSIGTGIPYWCVLNSVKWSVPCFLMVTGMLLLDSEKKVSYKKLYTKYIFRVLKALLVFGTIYTLLEVIAAPDDKGGVFIRGFAEIFTGNSWSHLWYLYCLLGLYLLLPAYKLITGHAKKRDIIYLLVIYAFFLSVLNFFSGFGVTLGFYIHVSSIYPFWFFLGYYMKRWGLKKRTSFYLMLFIVSTAALVFLTAFRWTYVIEPLEKLFNYTSFIVIIQTIGITGLFFRIRPVSRGTVDRILGLMDKNSFGIYMIHMIFVWLLFQQIGFNPFIYGGFAGCLLVIAAIYLLSLIISVILRKTPFFRTFL